MIKFKRRRSIVIFIILTLYLIVLAFIIRDRYLQLSNDVVEQESPIIIKRQDPVVVEEPVEEQVVIPETALLTVPFTSQAPFGVWDALHEETCEEASLMMVKYFREREKFSSAQVVDNELIKLVDWETINGYKVDVTVSELSQIAANYYKIKTGRIITDPTVEVIKKEIASGRPVIVPAAGRILPNPNFTPPGPKYHMLVIKGYNSTEFITNDPGTRKGEGFVYSYNSLLNALHDWDPNNILNGRKAVLVFD